jgi:hypothetical protein
VRAVESHGPHSQEHAVRRPVEGFAAFFAKLLDLKSYDLVHLLIPEKGDEWFRTGNVVAPRAFIISTFEMFALGGSLRKRK